VKQLAATLALLFAASGARGQDGGAVSQPAAPPEAASLRQVAEKKSAEWEVLARALDGKIARMLPCDARVSSAIEEVSRASEARLAALADALKAEADRARTDSGQARAAVTGEESRLREKDAERVDSAQERTDVDRQLADLTEGAKRQAAFEDARKKLALIAASIDRRAADSADAENLDTALNTSLRELLVACQAREAALAKEQAALAAEASRWSVYYTARLARAGIECSVTNPAGAKKKK
jgi:hypothetical protein